MLQQLLQHSGGCNMPIHALLWQAMLTRKVAHTDLVFGVWIAFISSYVHPRLQLSVQWLQLIPP